jgi:hypothetical protein
MGLWRRATRTSKILKVMNEVTRVRGGNTKRSGESGKYQVKMV